MDEKTNQRLSELLILLACGKKDALLEIYAIMSKLLYTIGNYYYTQEADIKDAIQNLLEKLLREARKFKYNINASAWILQMYKNSINNHLKRRRIEKKYIDMETEICMTSSSFDIDEKYIENYLFVREIFDKLSTYEQDLVIYRFWCNCSLSEMAKILKKPLTTIESQLTKLKDKITKI